MPSKVSTASNNKRSLESLSASELLHEVDIRDRRIAELEKACKKLKKEKSTTPASATKNVSPEKAQETAEKLRTLAVRGIKKQMTWKPSCKYWANPRFSWSSLCDEASFRAFMNLGEKEKTKGRKMTVDEFQTLVGDTVEGSIRYGCLYIRSMVNITYGKSGGLKITGCYGM